MSLHRRAAKRDGTEKAIVATLEAHGCIVWPINGTGLTDLLVFHRKRAGHALDRERRTYVADCKSAKGKPTPAQVKRWTELTNLGFSVFILRTPEDAVAMLNDALQAWEPEITGSIRAPRPHGDDRRPRRGDAAKARGTCQKCGHIRSAHDKRRGCTKSHPRIGICGCLEDQSGNLAEAYTPPRSKPVDAAKEAEVFAPPCSCTREVPCVKCSVPDPPCRTVDCRGTARAPYIYCGECHAAAVLG